MTPEEFRKAYDNPVLRENLALENMEHVKRCILRLRWPETSATNQPQLRALEIGCYRGGMTRFLLQNGIQFVDCVDTFEGSPEHKDRPMMIQAKSQFLSNMANYAGRYYCFTGNSLGFYCDRAVMFENPVVEQDFDLIYIDASHDSRDVIVDSVLSFQLLKVGGILIWDDFLWRYYENEYRNPKPAIDFFLAAFEPQIEVLEKNYQVSVRRTA